MDERTKLTGLARLSPRLRLLTKLSRSENPILSIGATHLLRDRTARRLGGFFEFAFLMLLPIITVIMAAFIYTEFAHRTHEIQTGLRNPSVYWMTRIYFATGYGIRIAAYVCGFLLLVIPAATISKREASGSVLRFLPVDRNEVFGGMAKLQLVSFVLAPAIFYIFELAIIFTVTMLGKSMGARYFAYIMPPGYTLDVRILLTAWSLISLFYLVVYSIYTGFRYRIVWPSFLALCLGYFLFVFTVFMGTATLAAYSTYDYDSNGIFVTWAIILTSILFAITLAFARSAVSQRIKPEK